MSVNMNEYGPAYATGGWFPLTNWSLIAQAGGVGNNTDPAAQESARREVLGILLHRYLPALRAHLLARSIRTDRADDLLQAFVADRVIERNLLAHADRARGRFRTFLVTSLNNFCANQFRFDRAERRAPKGAKVLGLGGTQGIDAPDADKPAFDIVDENAADETDVFDVTWARQVMAEGLRRMRAECVGCGRIDLWEVFDLRVLRPAFEDAKPLAYDEMVRRFGYATPKHAANALVTAKRRFETALRSVLAEYVNDESELDREQAALGTILSSPRARSLRVSKSLDSGAGD